MQNVEVLPANVTNERGLFLDSSAIFESTDLFKSVKLRILALQKAEQGLDCRPTTVPDTIKAALGCAFGGYYFTFLQENHQDPSEIEEYEKLKRALADVLRTCISFLQHPYFNSNPSEYNRERLIVAILSKRRSLHRKKRLISKAAESLHQANYFASLPSQQRASLHVANDGLIWYILKRVVASRMTPGSGDLELALQRSCIRLLDEMYVMWRITDFRE